MNQQKNIEKQIATSNSIQKAIGHDPGIIKLHGDASNREYFRITTKNQTYILMLLPSNKPESLAEEYNKDKLKGVELPFLKMQRHLQQKGVHVPEIIAVDVENRMILLEDFGDDLLLTVVQRDKNKREMR